jgi:alpha-amylase
VTSPSSSRRRFRTQLVVGIGSAAVVVAGGVAALSATSASAAPADAGLHDVQANLFEWNWNSVAKECTQILGPAGYGGVQVAPPQDSVKRQRLGDGQDTILHPWWEVYQPVDYNLTSRMGTQAQFKSMVATCRKAGVKVYVDAVINHMTGQGDTSYGGQHYTKYNYPLAGYTSANFHSNPADCPIAPAAGSGSQNGSIDDFNDYRQVTKCELVGLSDLATDTPYVQDKIAAYLNKLLSFGVAGFRVDAAKHYGLEDLAVLKSKLNKNVYGDAPQLALEVFPGDGRNSAAAFTQVGTVLGFDYAYQIKDSFKSYDPAPPHDGNIGNLKIFGAAAGLLPSDKELVFIENHDTERDHTNTLNYTDPNNTIANEFMLAYPYGTPQVYASFAWSNRDDSPPSNSEGIITDTVCDNTTWVCVDRYTGIKGMVGFHNFVGDAPVKNWYDDGDNLIAFSRGTSGFFSTNNEAAANTVTVRTGLSGGRYCDIIHGTVSNGGCSGPTVTVSNNGMATITVDSHDSVAFTAKDKLT